LAGRSEVAARPPFESLHEVACRLGDLIAERFNAVFGAALREDNRWLLEPFGYALIYGAQWRLDSHAQFLRAERRYGSRLLRSGRAAELLAPSEERENKIRTSLRREDVPVEDLLRVYERIINDDTALAPAIRAQFTGFLAMLTYELPLAALRPLLPAIRTMLRKLSVCSDVGCVQTWCRPIRDLTMEPVSTSGIAVFGLVECAWRDRFDGQTAVDILIQQSEKAANGAHVGCLALSEDDREAIVSALRRPPEPRADVLRVFGRGFLQLIVLDRPLVGGVFSVLLEGEDHSSLQALVEQIAVSEWAWLGYGFLRPVYERLLKSENAVLARGCVHHVACAYLVGLEELHGESSVLARLRSELKEQDRAALADIICNAFDELGRNEAHWPRVKAFWRLAADEAGLQTTRELGGFWRCLQQGRHTIGGETTEVKLHVPESIDTLAPLLEKTCAALASDPGYSANAKEAVARYLGAQSVGHETIAVRLLGLCLGVHTRDYDYIIVDCHEDAREVLRNAISAGGEARKLATEIIERHEVESDKSLAGLLL